MPHQTSDLSTCGIFLYATSSHSRVYYDKPRILNELKGSIHQQIIQINIEEWRTIFAIGSNNVSVRMAPYDI